MQWRRLWRCLPILLVAVLAWSPAHPVVAQGQPAPPPMLRLQQVAPATIPPARPAAGQAVLYDQMDSSDPNLYILSQKSTSSVYDSLAADDFFVNSSFSSWQITAVEVAGLYKIGSGNPSVNSVSVEFYADGGGRPGYPVYTANAQPISGTASSGNFYLPLATPAYLASNAKYWVSVQAIQSTDWYWYWFERKALSLSPAVWKNPSGFFVPYCVDWTAINLCYAGTGPDLLFRLYGTESSHHVPPPVFLPLVRR